MQVLTSSPQVTSQPAQTDTAASSATQTTATETTGTTAAPATAASEEKQVFSSRGEKFAQLNKEFDITGSDFKITNGFLSRLSELGLITESEASKLAGGLNSVTGSTDTVGGLKGAIDAISERVKDEDGVSGLLKLLENSKEILDNLDGSKSKTFPVDPATAAAELESFLKSDEADILTDKEKDSLKDVQTALTIADKLSPEQRTSAEVSKYMSILKQFG
ncbi:hypothetical protein [Aliamphritea hakodatensis]|uniref:hypothetical protein n=1 Tax=Aliamphritea hakodatensis TaxID=2895352 RepID=UPI0022FDAB02|nr:hypothetical protein [Aliamphritea hakodatensis]